MNKQEIRETKSAIELLIALAILLVSIVIGFVVNPAAIVIGMLFSGAFATASAEDTIDPEKVDLHIYKVNNEKEES